MRSKRLKLGEIELEIPPLVYEPAEDTFLIFDEIPECEDKRCLDVGTGSGVLAIKMAIAGGKVVGTDISFEALKAARRNARKNGVEIELVRCDLASAISGKFDLITFNPPYLPFTDEVPEAIWWSGGKKVIERFLRRDLPRILKREGELLMVYSSLSGISDLSSLIPKNMKWRKIKEEAFDFERIYLVKVFWS